MNNGTINRSDINESNLQVIDATNSPRLTQNQITLKKSLEFLIRTQLNIFIVVFYSLFNGFSKCAHFPLGCLKNVQPRMNSLQAFLRSSDLFTSLSGENVRKQQRWRTMMSKFKCLLFDGKMLTNFFDGDDKIRLYIFECSTKKWSSLYFVTFVQNRAENIGEWHILCTSDRYFDASPIKHQNLNIANNAHYECEKPFS